MEILSSDNDWKVLFVYKAKTEKNCFFLRAAKCFSWNST